MVIILTLILYTYIGKGLTSVKHGLQRGASKVITKEEAKSIGAGLHKAATSKPVKKTLGVLSEYGERQRRMYMDKPKPTPKKKKSNRVIKTNSSRYKRLF